MTTAIARSQNGFTANDRTVIASYTVPGTTLKIALRKGDVSVVLLDFLARYHREVESLYHSPQDLWGYAERAIRGSSTTLSNHASGTAADHRAVDHPLGAVGTFTAAELHALNRILAYYEGVLRHGKDYTVRKDEMHVEVNASAAEVKRIAEKIRSGAKPTIPAVGGSPVSTRDEVWQAPVPDYVTAAPNDTVQTWQAVAWANAHAAAARAASEATFAVVSRIEKSLAAHAVTPVPGGGPVALTDADVARVAAAVVDLLSQRTAA